MSSKGKTTSLAALAIALVLALSAAAAAAPITIGQLPGSVPPAICQNDIDHFQVGVSSGSDYRVPQGYTEITSWSTYAAFGAGQEMALKVYDEQSSTQYVVLREDGPRQLSSGSVNTFPVEIPVAHGDIVGNNSANGFTVHNACSFATGQEGDRIATAVPGTPLHETGDFATGGELLTNVSVTLARPPTLTLISPSSGLTNGGDRVVLAGHDLTGAKTVKFGEATAKFLVVSDDEISATAPAVAAPGPVDVTVTTAAGTTPKVDGDKFSYAVACTCPGESEPPAAPRCVVPKLKGKKLKAVRKALKSGDCKLGKVRGAHGKQARVKKQGSKPGARLPGGSQVSVKLALP